METLRNRLRTLLPEEAPAEDALLDELLQGAQALILSYTGRETMPEALTSCQLSLAVQAYNRLGSEGERQRREGGLMIQYDGLPESVLRQMRAWRLARLPAL